MCNMSKHTAEYTPAPETGAETAWRNILRAANTHPADMTVGEIWYRLGEVNMPRDFDGQGNLDPLMSHYNESKALELHGRLRNFLTALFPYGLVKSSDGLFTVHAGAGYTTLGWDVAEKRARAVADWILETGGDCSAYGAGYTFPVKGTGAGYMEYAQLMEHGRQLSELLKTEGKPWQCPAELTPQLTGKEGQRVEVTDCFGQTRRFIVGKSTGWMPCHLEISRRNSSGGHAVTGPFKSVSIVIGGKAWKA
jgi:hypothetical protein